jgi:FixJ family two-component response regulator
MSRSERPAPARERQLVSDKSLLIREPVAPRRAAWIAVVDDDASVRTALARLLRAEGIAVTTFATAQEFLTANDADVPSCVVLDVHLGAVTGFEVQDRLASTHPDLPVIFITGHDEIPSAELTRRTGPDGFLRKPFDSDTFLSVVRRRARLDAEP